MNKKLNDLIIAVESTYSEQMKDEVERKGYFVLGVTLSLLTLVVAGGCVVVVSLFNYY